MLRLTLRGLRRDRCYLLLWIGGIAGLAGASAAAVGREFGDEQERAGIVAVAVVNPAFLFLRGTPDGTDVGAVVFFQAFAFLAVLAGLMNTFLVVRNTRGDEEAGRSELVGATPTSRLAPLGAVLLLVLCADVALGGLTAAALWAAGLDPVGAGLTGAALASTGLVFAAAAALLAQVLPTARAANGAAGGLVGLAYVVRGIGDALGTPDPELTRAETGWLSWLSPIGWSQRVSPFAEQNPVPLLLSAALAVALAAIALSLRSRRDLGSSLVPERSGRETAGAFLPSAMGLAWRLQRPALLGWAAGAAVLGSIAGLLAPLVGQAVAANASLSELIARLVPGSQAEAVDVFSAAILGMSGVLAAAAGAQAVMRLRSDEAEGRAELLLAAPLTARRWLSAQLAVGFGSAVAVALVAGLASGLGFLASGGEPDRWGVGVAAALAHVPAAVVLVAVAALAFSLLPRLTTALAWGALALALVLGQLGELLGIPEWLQNVSPFRHSSALPVEELDWWSTGIMTGAAVLIGAAAVGLVRARDLTS